MEMGKLASELIQFNEKSLGWWEINYSIFNAAHCIWTLDKTSAVFEVYLVYEPWSSLVASRVEVNTWGLANIFIFSSEKRILYRYEK